MALVRFTIVLTLLTSFYLTARSQQNDLSLLIKIASQKANILDDPDQAERTSHKSLSFPTRILFGFYRNTISEQISADCAFDLSCSRFSIHAIRRFGLLKGGLLTADRLTRCGSFAGKHTVPIFYNIRTGKVIDDPSMY
jgi:putative component of membrane protein insertase Oxa1/YidC/SpoIIIJ protein YidD